MSRTWKCIVSGCFEQIPTYEVFCARHNAGYTRFINPLPKPWWRRLLEKVVDLLS